MRKPGLFAASLFAIAIPLFAQPVKTTRVTLNGRPFASAEFLSGQWAVPLQDFARAAGGTVTLEPNFQLRGTNLYGVSPAEPLDAKVKIKFTTTVKDKVDTFAQSKDKWQPGSIFHVQNSGLISSHVFMVNGRAFVPLADIAKAFGAPYNEVANKPADDKPTESISLNFGKIRLSALAMN